MSPYDGPRSRLLAALGTIPSGRVATFDALAADAATTPRHIETLIAGLCSDERQSVPWHRAVAKGGAIGWGPRREEQFARLVREGVPVSPAGIVQDMARLAMADLQGMAARKPRSLEPAATPPRLGRSRGMKVRPVGTRN